MKIKWLWINDYYDLPLSGAALVNNKLYYFLIANHDDVLDKNHIPTYGYIPVTPDMASLELIGQELYEKYVTPKKGEHDFCFKNPAYIHYQKEYVKFLKENPPEFEIKGTFSW